MTESMTDYSQFKDRFIGPKKVEFAELTGETTELGSALVKVMFADGTVEQFSSVMFEHIVSEEACDLSELRDKRIKPIVGAMLELLREWGIRVGETGYLSVLLNQSLDFNRNEAEKMLWSDYMPKPMDLGDVDLVTVDRVLKKYATQSS